MNKEEMQDIKERLELFPDNMNKEAQEGYYKLFDCIDKLQQEYEQLKEEIKRTNTIINKLEKYLKEEQDRLITECSNIYVDSLDKTHLVNEDIFNEITKIKDKLK